MLSLIIFICTYEHFPALLNQIWTIEISKSSVQLNFQTNDDKIVNHNLLVLTALEIAIPVSAPSIGLSSFTRVFVGPNVIGTTPKLCSLKQMSTLISGHIQWNTYFSCNFESNLEQNRNKTNIRI